MQKTKGFSSKRLLFVSEAVTAAHVTRPLALCRSLEKENIEIHFASADRFASLYEGFETQRWPLYSISALDFTRALSRGLPPFGYQTLKRYIEEDLALIRRIKPDLIVSDMRISLSISAKLAQVPLATITNAHWSPYARGETYPLPEHPLVKWLGVALASSLMKPLIPWVLRLHAFPLNRLRRHYGLRPFANMEEVYSYGDYTLFSDSPEIVPTNNLPTNQRYLGPILWKGSIALPPWWDEVDSTRPSLFISMGSSGDSSLLPLLVASLARQNVNLLVATAGRTRLSSSPKNVYVADYLPADLASRRASLVICNGGSTLAYQAICEGVPVLGIPFNLDQYLCMEKFCAKGLGKRLRSGTLTSCRLSQIVMEMLSDNQLSARVRLAARDIATLDAEESFRSFLKERGFYP